MRRMFVVWVALVSVAGFVAVARRRGATRPDRSIRFDPVVVGTIEADGWRAYYDRDFVTGFRLLLRLMREQFGLGPLGAIRAAHAAVRAQRAFAPVANDLDATLRWLTRFYELSPRRDGVAAVDLARAELDYWIVHRRIVDQADKRELVDAFTRLHVLLFGGDEVTMRPSAEQRTLACNTVDRITGKRSLDLEGDWRSAREHLIAAYQLAVAASPVQASN
ncbi:MAG TPA: hypothetical protein VFV93_17925 [Thermomicrobiales bacterium]|nr:hypothetical protein [Thermomicrobiales bacterium]